jgi:transposase
MEATDMRSLWRDARHERRVQVIRLRKAGQTYGEIAAQTGLSRTGVFDICKRHEAAGAQGLRDAPTGRHSGDGRLLDATQEAAVRKLITDKTPDQLKMRYALWTRTAVAHPAHPATLWTPAACAHDGSVPGALGLHAAKADEEGLRAVARGGQEVAR